MSKITVRLVVAAATRLKVEFDARLFGSDSAGTDVVAGHPRVRRDPPSVPLAGPSVAARPHIRPAGSENLRGVWVAAKVLLSCCNRAITKWSDRIHRW
jgi:hypothetical protein